jgi:hypothetical protein
MCLPAGRQVHYSLSMIMPPGIKCKNGSKNGSLFEQFSYKKLSGIAGYELIP